MSVLYGYQVVIRLGASGITRFSVITVRGAMWLSFGIKELLGNEAVLDFLR